MTEEEMKKFYLELKENINIPKFEWQLRDNELAYEDGISTVLNRLDTAYIKTVKKLSKKDI